MSKLTVRVALSVLISLGVIFAIYTSVEALQSQDHVGSASAAVINGALSNPDYDRNLNDFNGQNHGGGCESKGVNPSDF